MQIRLNASKDDAAFSSDTLTTTILPFTYELPVVKSSEERSTVKGSLGVAGADEDLEHAFNNDPAHTNATAWPMFEIKSRLSIFVVLEMTALMQRVKALLWQLCC